jgi:hypothetical protein
MFYRLSNPDITSISVDGFEHKVNPASGLLEVEMLTPNLIHDLEVVRGAVKVDPAEAQAMAEKAEAAKAQASRRPSAKEGAAS